MLPSLVTEGAEIRSEHMETFLGEEGPSGWANRSGVNVEIRNAGQGRVEALASASNERRRLV